MMYVLQTCNFESLSEQQQHVHEELVNHAHPLEKGRLRSNAKSPTTQYMFSPTPSFISCPEVTGSCMGTAIFCKKDSEVAGLM